MPHLPPSWAEHLDTGVSNRLAACDVTGRPEICRALASRQRADGRIDVLLAADEVIRKGRRVASWMLEAAEADVLLVPGGE